MVYVDLNPIRAGISNTPEESEFTSIYDRINNLKKQVKLDLSLDNAQIINDAKQVEHLLALNSAKNIGPCAEIDIPLSDYLDLVDYTGRVVREDKKGVIPSHLKPILSRLQWVVIYA